MPQDVSLRPNAALPHFRARHTLLLVALCLLLLARVVQAQGPGASLSAQWQLLGPPEPPTVGDVITLRLQVSHPADVTVELPSLPTQWGDLQVRTLRTSPPEEAQDGRRTTSLEVEAVLWSPGDHPLPPINVVYRDAQGLPQELFVEPLTISVASVLSEDDLTKRDLKPQAEIPRPPRWPWLLAGALAAIGLALFVRRLLNRRVTHNKGLPTVTQPVNLRSAEEIAFEELDRIERLRLPERSEFKRFYTLLTDCARAYVERRYAIQAMDLTTGELLGDLAKANPPEEALTDLIWMLRTADLVKFARMRPEIRGANQGLAVARRVVRLTTPAQREDASPTGQLATRSGEDA